MFSLGQKVVYPGHGVATIVNVVSKHIASRETIFFELKFIHQDMTILVPRDTSEHIGIRLLSTQELIDDIFAVLRQPARAITHREFTASCWNRRNKEYQVKLRRGSLRELSEIYRDLRCIESQKGLSFGEKNIMLRAEALLIEEIVEVRAVSKDSALNHLRSHEFAFE